MPNGVTRSPGAPLKPCVVRFEILSSVFLDILLQFRASERRWVVVLDSLRAHP